MQIHFEILVEDLSGKRALDILVPKIIGKKNSYKIHPYKGIGHLPKKLRPKTGADRRILLDQLPRLLIGYGKTFANYPRNYRSAVIVVCDLDDKDFKRFLSLLEQMKALYACPPTYFCIAVEELEAWFLGDIPAIQKAYPKAKKHILNGYQNDSICGTWEKLADALVHGGAVSLSKQGGHMVGKEKSEWAKKIAPNMDVYNNSSKSFAHFRDTLLKLI